MTATLTKTLGSLDDFRGTLCVPGDPDYPRVRAIWNGQVAREHPEVMGPLCRGEHHREEGNDRDADDAAARSSSGTWNAALT